MLLWSQFKMLKHKICPICKTNFTSDCNANQKFCSKKCRLRARYLRLKSDPTKWSKFLQKQRDKWAKYRKDYNQYQRERYNRRKEIIKSDNERTRLELEKLIGNRCILCGSTNRIHFHEIHGKKHPRTTEGALKYYTEHKNDFVPLCMKHHSVLHLLAKSSPINIEELSKLIAYLRSNKKVIEIFRVG